MWGTGGLVGSDMRLIRWDVQGIDNHQVPSLGLRKFGAVAKTKKGEVLLILIFCQYAHIQNGKSIHSSLQMEDNNMTVNDRPIRLRGDQSLTPPPARDTFYEFLRLPHVYMTRDIPWVPSRYDASSSYPGRNCNVITQEGFDFWHAS